MMTTEVVGLHFLRGGSNDLSHFGAHIAQKAGEAAPHAHRIAGEIRESTRLLTLAGTVVALLDR